MDEQSAHKTAKERAEKWLESIRAVEKRSDKWAKSAEYAEAAYSNNAEGTADGKEYRWNVLHSNVETIVPSIYNSTPTPDIRDRHRSGDQVVKDVANIFERIISIQIDDNALDSEIEASTQDAFMAGRGVVRVKFDADINEVESIDPTTFEPVVSQQVSNERIEYEVVSWRDYREGPANKFKSVPWVAFGHWIPKERIDEISDEELVSGQVETVASGGDGDENGDIRVWEIWCKDSRTVKFVRETDAVMLREIEDPLGLVGFFPISKPVQPITLSGKRTPVCPFEIYRKLADELDETSRRISVITKGLKVRGWIVGSSDDVAKLADASDNELIPITGFENAAATGGIDKAIVWWPIETASRVLRELYASQERLLQSIYEITGISDIVRGASSSSETATAQQIKTQWGSLRIKKLQNMIQRQVRDLFVISAEIISSKFSPETITAMTGMDLTDEHIALIQSPLQRYHINVESDSTIRADLSRMKGEVAEFLSGTSQYFATMGPLVAQAPEAAEPVAEIYASFARLFNLGKQGEDAIERIVEISKQAARQPRPNPEAEAAKVDAEMRSQEMQLKAQDMQHRHKEYTDKIGLEIEKLRLERETKIVDLDIKRAELEIKQAEVLIKQQDSNTRARQAEVINGGS